MYINIDFSDQKNNSLKLPHFMLAIILILYIFFVNYYSIAKIIASSIEHKKLSKMYDNIKSSSENIIKNIKKDPSQDIMKINKIINKRNFSLTTILNTLEIVTSPEIKITSILFSSKSEGNNEKLVGVASNIESLTKFINTLTNSSKFKNIFLKRQIILDNNMIQFQIYYNWNN